MMVEIPVCTCVYKAHFKGIHRMFQRKISAEIARILCYVEFICFSIVKASEAIQRARDA